MELKILKDTPPWDWPHDAGAMLLAILRDHRAKQSDRLVAAELAGNFTVLDDRVAGALLDIVRSSAASLELRGTAAISLGPALEHADTVEADDADDAIISEQTFRDIQGTLREMFYRTDIPEDVRRKILEASVRAPEDWHYEAVRLASASDDEAWKRTAVFCMRFVGGFDEEILAALSSEHPEVHYQAVCAAGSRELGAAWKHVAALVTSDDTDKELRLAAIDAAASIRPSEAAEILVDLTESEDEDIADAAFEALAMAEAISDQEDEDEEEDDDEYFR
jgi:hypothetical protein